MNEQLGLFDLDDLLRPLDGCVPCALVDDARFRRASNWLGGKHDDYIAAVIELYEIGDHE